MHIVIGADHRGFALKRELISWLETQGHSVEDAGALIEDSGDDYPDFGAEVGYRVSQNDGARGVVICGSGIGITIAAGKVSGIRAGTGSTPAQVRAARADEDLNVLGLSSDIVDGDAAKAIIVAFLETPFSNEPRHLRRIEKLTDIESHGSSSRRPGNPRVHEA
jgi:ribose 5-phosphate isomerase B